MNPTCPTCGTPLKRYGRGATAKKHGPRYICPQAVAEQESLRDPITGRYRPERTRHDGSQYIFQPWEVEVTR